MKLLIKFNSHFWDNDETIYKVMGRNSDSGGYSVNRKVREMCYLFETKKDAKEAIKKLKELKIKGLQVELEE